MYFVQAKIKLYIKVRFFKIKLMVRVVFLFLMVLFLKEHLNLINLSMEFFFLILHAIMWVILRIFKLQVKECLKINKMDIDIKGNGRRIQHMVKVFKNISIINSIQVDFQLEINLEKVSINFLMEKYMKVHFLMVIVTVMVNY